MEEEIKNECSRCGYDYPEEVGLSPMFGSISSGPVCGICALEMSNAALGIRRVRFDGGIAESYRQAAIKARADKTAKPPKEDKIW